MAARADSLRPLAGDTSRFSLVAALPSIQDDSRLDIVVERRPTQSDTSAFSPYMATNLRVGEPWRFSTGFGLGLTSSARKRFTLLPTESDSIQPTVDGVVDDARFLPYVWFDTRVYGVFGITVGVGAKLEGETSADMIIGASASLWRDKVRLLLGGVLGEQEALPTGVREDKRLPVGFDDLEVNMVRRFGLIVGLNYAIW